MKILWFKAGGLVPLDTGGKIRSYHILRELARKHEVTFFGFYIAQDCDQHPDLASLFHRVIAVPLPIPSGRGARQLINYIAHLSSGLPFTVSKYCLPTVKNRLAALLKESQFDLIICDFVFSGGAMLWDTGCPVVLFTHNVEALIWKRHFEVARNPLWKAVAWLEYQRTCRFERECLQEATHVLTVSGTDRDYFARFVPREKITAISTGVDTEFFSSDGGPEQPHTLVFTGSMDWMPNEDAIVYFGRDILPKVRAVIPDVEVKIVGRHPSARLRELGEKLGMIVTGTVEDIRPYVRQSAVYVVPLRVGGGTRLKIFEAMSMGKAIVSTTIGAEGLPVTHDGDILLADSPDDFARAILKLLRNDAERRRLGAAARALVEQKYSWPTIGVDFEAALEKIYGAQNVVTTRHQHWTVPQS